MSTCVWYTATACTAEECAEPQRSCEHHDDGYLVDIAREMQREDREERWQHDREQAEFDTYR